MREIKEEEKKFIVSLSKKPRLRLKLHDIINYFSDFEYFWDRATFSEFKKAGLNEGDFEEYNNLKNTVIPDEEIEKLKKDDIKVISVSDKNYPNLLKEISKPPIILFVRGRLSEKDFTFAIVGARRPTHYGLDITPQFSEKLAQAGIVIVSGMAIGVDTLAHKGAVAVGKRTVAVLGSGINDASIYPSSNRGLAQKILENDGAIISEYPPGYQIHKMNFPERNRIISGMSKGTLVVEAKIRSGALITANFALEQNREVFAVPGDIKRKESEGPNNLIKLGAKPVISHADILEEFGIEEKEAENIKADTEEEAKILEILEEGPFHIDLIAKKADLTISETSSTLSMMEIKGKIQNLGALTFSAKR